MGDLRPALSSLTQCYCALPTGYSQSKFYIVGPVLIYKSYFTEKIRLKTTNQKQNFKPPSSESLIYESKSELGKLKAVLLGINVSVYIRIYSWKQMTCILVLWKICGVNLPSPNADELAFLYFLVFIWHIAAYLWNCLNSMVCSSGNHFPLKSQFEGQITNRN